MCIIPFYSQHQNSLSWSLQSKKLIEGSWLDSLLCCVRDLMKSEKTWVMGSGLDSNSEATRWTKMTARTCSCIWVSGSMLVMEEYKFESDGQQARGLGSVYGEPSWEDSGMDRCEGTHMWVQHFVCQRWMFTGLMFHIRIPVLISIAESVVPCSNSSASIGK